MQRGKAPVQWGRKYGLDWTGLPFLSVVGELEFYIKCHRQCHKLYHTHDKTVWSRARQETHHLLCTSGTGGVERLFFTFTAWPFHLISVSLPFQCFVFIFLFFLKKRRDHVACLPPPASHISYVRLSCVCFFLVYIQCINVRKLRKGKNVDLRIIP